MTGSSLSLYGQAFDSRLMIGSAHYPSPAVLLAAIDAAHPAMVTVALRRQSPARGGERFWQTLQATGVMLLPNTAGCHEATEAVELAEMSREVFESDWIKLEVIGDDHTLQPCPFGLVEAARELIRRGFRVLPYCTEDLALARRLLDVGCEVLMPWAAPIGSGLGPINPLALQTLRERLPKIPLIVDAGLGAPSQATRVLEMGLDGVLLNTAIARADDPATMARAFRQAVEAGRQAYEAGLMTPQPRATASTPVPGFPLWHST